MVGVVEKPEFLSQHRSWSHQGHIAGNHIHHLRHLIDTPSTQDPTEGCDPGIGLVAVQHLRVRGADDIAPLLIRTNIHSAELGDGDHVAATTDPLLPVQHRSATACEGADSSHDHERREEQKQQRSEDHVQCSLDRAFRTSEVRLIQMQQWQVSGHAHCDAGPCHIADIRCDQQVYARSFKAPCQTLDDGLLQCAGTSYRHGVRIFQTNARHHFI